MYPELRSWLSSSGDKVQRTRCVKHHVGASSCLNLTHFDSPPSGMYRWMRPLCPMQTKQRKFESPSIHGTHSIGFRAPLLLFSWIRYSTTWIILVVGHLGIVFLLKWFLGEGIIAYECTSHSSKKSVIKLYRVWSLDFFSRNDTRVSFKDLSFFIRCYLRWTGNKHMKGWVLELDGWEVRLYATISSHRMWIQLCTLILIYLC